MHLCLAHYLLQENTLNMTKNGGSTHTFNSSFNTCSAEMHIYQPCFFVYSSLILLYFYFPYCPFCFFLSFFYIYIFCYLQLICCHFYNTIMCCRIKIYFKQCGDREQKKLRQLRKKRATIIER